jgi:hypothetical protein
MTSFCQVAGAEASLSGRRLDRWLWFARLVKSRSRGARRCGAGAVAVNGMTVKKGQPHCANRGERHGAAGGLLPHRSSAGARRASRPGGRSPPLICGDRASGSSDRADTGVAAATVGRGRRFEPIARQSSRKRSSYWVRRRAINDFAILLNTVWRLLGVAASKKPPFDVVAQFCSAALLAPSLPRPIV